MVENVNSGIAKEASVENIYEEIKAIEKGNIMEIGEWECFYWESVQVSEQRADVQKANAFNYKKRFLIFFH